MYSYKEFEEAVIDMIRFYLPPDSVGADISVQEVTRNNDRKAAALHIRKEDDRVVPNIYLEDFYKIYQRKDNLDEILKSIADTYKQSRLISDKVLSFDPKEYENVKDRLYITLMNEAMNTDYLAGKIHKSIPGTGLSAVVRVMCSKEEHSSFAVSEGMAATWEVSEDELYKLALKNSERILPVALHDMTEILKGPLTVGLNHDQDEDKGVRSWKLWPNRQYVLTNEEGLGGASAMLYEDVLKKIAGETGSNLIILPSSLHEVILMKDTGEVSVNELQNMVMSINRAHVRPEEVLSDEVYYYDAKEQKLVLATDPEQTKIYQAQMVEDRGYGSGDEFPQWEEDDEDWER